MGVCKCQQKSNKFLNKINQKQDSLNPLKGYSSELKDLVSRFLPTVVCGIWFDK